MLSIKALLGACAITLSTATAHAAPFMIVGDDAKADYDAAGNAVVNPTGNDAVLIVDLAKPEDPKIVATLPLENSIVGPPTNLGISPNGSIALVADSITVTQENGANKAGPTNKLFVIDMKATPPKLADTLTLGKQPSGLSFSPDGKMALVANRGDGTISVLKIDGTKVTMTGSVQVSAGVAHVDFAPDGKHAYAVRSPDNRVAVLTIDGDKVTYDKAQDIPTSLFPYNIVIAPNGKLALTADNGGGGSSDGSMDMVSVIDLTGPHPHTLYRINVEDAPEGLAMSPKGNLAVVVNVNGSNMPQAWFHRKTGDITVLRIVGNQVTATKTIQVGRLPEAAVFSPDGRYIYVGNYLDNDFSILKVNGSDVVDTGKRFKVPGHPASARMGPG